MISKPFAAVTVAQIAGFDPAAQIVNDFTVQGDFINDDFQAIVLRRIVAAGDHHPGMAGTEGMSRVIQQRGGNRAQIQRFQPGGANPGFHRLRQQRAGQPPIAAHDDLGFTPFGGQTGDRLTDITDDGGR